MKIFNWLKSALTASLVIFPLMAHAGKEGGNGGNSVVCFKPDGTIRSAELLDIYEARTMHGITVDLGPHSIPYLDKVSEILNRLERRSPRRAEKYRAWIAEFQRDSLFLPGVTLVEVPDSDHIATPTGCKVAQLVVQRTPQFPEDKRFTVNQDIWDHLDNDSRAGMLMHEVIYREAFEENFHTNSISSRYFNSLLLSSKMKEITEKEFAETLVRLPFADLGLPGYNAQNSLIAQTGSFFRDDLERIHFKPLPMEFDASTGGLKSVWIVPNGAFRWKELGATLEISDNHRFQNPFRVDLFPTGEIMNLYMREGGIYLRAKSAKYIISSGSAGVINMDRSGRPLTFSRSNDESSSGWKGVLYYNTHHSIWLCPETATRPAGVAYFDSELRVLEIRGGYRGKAFDLPEHNDCKKW